MNRKINRTLFAIGITAVALTAAVACGAAYLIKLDQPVFFKHYADCMVSVEEGETFFFANLNIFFAATVMAILLRIWLMVQMRRLSKIL